MATKDPSVKSARPVKGMGMGKGKGYMKRSPKALTRPGQSVSAAKRPAVSSAVSSLKKK